MIAFVFPGQGSQVVGMAYDFYKEFPQSADVFHSAETALRQNIAEIIFHGTQEELDKTQITQPAVLIASFAIYKALESMGIKAPNFVAGHSLGEYTALLVAGAIELFQAVRLAHIRATLMQNAVPEGEGSMVAILKLDIERVKKACEDASSYGLVEVANYNSPEQFVISGQRKAVEVAKENAIKMGAKAIELKVSVPSHCSLMKDAANAFRLKLAQTPIQNSRIRVVQNYTAKAHTMAHEIRENLYKQLFSPVLWLQSVEFMVSNGVDTFVEIGPKPVLSKLIQQTVKDVRVFSVCKVEDAKALIDAL
ncbi:MAG: ACP S-malonyltransferase [Aquificaceae bacterium]|nr:ACP S-malonyltransferase [Aquificaceae bacterium]MDW8237094.1 ACP S-malonyltransferase [Aquificaceae bacterium]